MYMYMYMYLYPNYHSHSALLKPPWWVQSLLIGIHRHHQSPQRAVV